MINKMRLTQTQRQATPKRTTSWLTAGIAQLEAFEAKHLHPKPIEQVQIGDILIAHAGEILAKDMRWSTSPKRGP